MTLAIPLAYLIVWLSPLGIISPWFLSTLCRAGMDRPLPVGVPLWVHQMVRILIRLMRLLFGVD